MGWLLEKICIEEGALKIVNVQCVVRGPKPSYIHWWSVRRLNGCGTYPRYELTQIMEDFRFLGSGVIDSPKSQTITGGISFGVLWGVWLCSNQWLFEKKCINLEHMLSKIVSRVHEFKEALRGA